MDKNLEMAALAVLIHDLRKHKKVTLNELAERIALDLGFRNVASGPMERSSYHADRQAAGV